MLISSSEPPFSRPEFETGWMCSLEELGLPVSSPRRWASSFWRLSSIPSWARKKTTPRSETAVQWSAWNCFVRQHKHSKCWIRTCNGQIPYQVVGIGGSEPFRETGIRKLLANHGGDVKRLELVKGSAEFERWLGLRGLRGGFEANDAIFSTALAPWAKRCFLRVRCHSVCQGMQFARWITLVVSRIKLSKQLGDGSLTRTC